MLKSKKINYCNYTITVLTGLLLTYLILDVKGINSFSPEDILYKDKLLSLMGIYLQNLSITNADHYVIILKGIIICGLKIFYIFISANHELCVLILLGINFSYIFGKDFYAKHFHWEKNENVFFYFYSLWLNKEKVIITFLFIIIVHFPFKYIIQALVLSNFNVDNFLTHCLVILLAWHFTAYFLSIIIEKIKEKKCLKDINYSIYNKFVIKSANLYTFSAITLNYYLSLNYTFYYYSIIFFILCLLICIIVYLYGQLYIPQKNTLPLEANGGEVFASLIGVGLFSYIIESMKIDSIGNGQNMQNYHNINKLKYFKSLETKHLGDGNSTINLLLNNTKIDNRASYAMNFVEDHGLIYNKIWFVVNQIRAEVTNLGIKQDRLVTKTFFIGKEYTGLTFWALDQKALHLVMLPKNMNDLTSLYLRSNLYGEGEEGIRTRSLQEVLDNFKNSGIVVDLNDFQNQHIKYIVTHTPMLEVGPKNSGLFEVFKPGGLNTRPFTETLVSNHLDMINNANSENFMEINDLLKRFSQQWKSNQEFSNEDIKLEEDLWKKFFLRNIEDVRKSLSQKGLYSEINSFGNSNALNHQVFFYGKDEGLTNIDDRLIPNTIIKSLYIFRDSNSLKDILNFLTENKILNMQDSKKRLLEAIVSSNGNRFYTHCISINGINIELYKLDKRSWNQTPIVHSYLTSHDPQEILVRHPNKIIIWKRPDDSLSLMKEKDQMISNVYINYIANKSDGILKKND